jgi:hypothetical protein
MALVNLSSRIIDKIDLDKQLRYRNEGITYVSNNNNVIPRDNAGNIILQEGATDNPLLVIEPISVRVTNQSLLKVLDTQFNYFKFPARIVAEDEPDIDLDLDLDFSNLEANELDVVYARYKPSEDRRIGTGDVNRPGAERYSGILMDEVVDGLPQKNTSGYFITKEIKNAGTDLRFRIKLQHKYQADVTGYGTSYFSLILNSPDRGVIREWKGPYANNSISNPTEFGSIAQYEIQTLNLDLIIPNGEFDIGDTISIGAFAGQNVDSQYHFIIADQSYWIVTDASKNVDEWNQEIS